MYGRRWHLMATVEFSSAMQKSSTPEILDGDNIPEPLVALAYRELTTIHRLLGDTRYLIQALRRNPQPVQRVLDIGCGRGGLLSEISSALRIEGIGIDLAPPALDSSKIIKADAARDPLPLADVAISVHVAHHLSPDGLIQMIRNVGRSCRRFIILDIVRSAVPLTLFRIFIAPFVSRITAVDGQTSIRRAYAPDELGALVKEALAGTNATFRHTVAPFGVRQVVDISYAANLRAVDKSDL
jgi:SAM-dependent methyltransferase